MRVFVTGRKALAFCLPGKGNLIGSRRNRMIDQTELARSFTLPGTSKIVNRMGYGAMHLAGRDATSWCGGLPKISIARWLFCERPSRAA